MLIRNAEVDGRQADVRCRDASISAIDSRLRALPGEADIDAAGGALLPGLVDHHLHLLALAASRASVPCGPPRVTDEAGLARALRAASGDGWIRGIGYHEAVAGPLDRLRLDALVSHRPVRIQHRSGVMWFVNSLASRLLRLDETAGPGGIERGPDGRANGRLFRLDDWLRERLPAATIPPVDDTSRELAAMGITAFTDATPHNDNATAHLMRALQSDGALRQRVLLMGDDTLDFEADDHLQRGPLKVMLDEAALPDLEALGTRIAVAHRSRRAVAFHCVTRVELLFALAALRQANGSPTHRRYGHGDRIEHAALTTPDDVALLHDAGVAVVTQPNLVAERGDQFRIEVPAGEHDDLYRLRTLLNAGIPLAGSTDAPFGRPDPWHAMRAAVDRTTPDGSTLAAGEALDPEQALALFTGRSQDPGGAQRKLAIGQPADLCLLHVPWREARRQLDRTLVRATLIAGSVVAGC